MDAVSDRDFAAEFCFAAALIGVHLSRLGEEIVLWSSQEFGWAEIDDAYATGSSIMPQKKNPDVAELARGKAGRLIGGLTGLLTTLKGLPLTYNRDLQEDKEPVFDAVDTLLLVLPAMAGLISMLRFIAERLRRAPRPASRLATDLAELLVRRGVPFREAHEVVGHLVVWCQVNDCELADVSDENLAKVSAHLTPDVREVLTVDGALAARRASAAPRRSGLPSSSRRCGGSTQHAAWAAAREPAGRRAWAVGAAEGILGPAVGRGRAGAARLRARASDRGGPGRRQDHRGRGVRGRVDPPRMPTGARRRGTRSCSARRVTPMSTSPTACTSASTWSASGRARVGGIAAGGRGDRGRGAGRGSRPRPAARPARAAGGRRGPPPLRDLARGPARLCQALAIDRALDGADVCDPGRTTAHQHPPAGSRRTPDPHRAPGRHQHRRRDALAVLAAGDPTVSPYRPQRARAPQAVSQRTLPPGGGA